MIPLPHAARGGELAALLPDGRLHLQHGPIDIIAQAFGDTAEVLAAYAQAGRRFGGILSELVAELPLLRTPLGKRPPDLRGVIARRMAAAVWPYRRVYITPMAAVAGAVAEEVLGALLAGRRVAKAYVNNGGDIAIYLGPGESLSLGVVADQDRPAIDARALIRAGDAARGIATSGWRGRSQSLGIADAATVFAPTAAGADAAATMIANAVDAAHPAVLKRPARSLRDDSDLGDLAVTVDVGPLDAATIDAALGRGLRRARALKRRGLILDAWISLQGRSRALLTPARPGG